MTDKEFIADQLSNTWEYMEPNEMFSHLTRETREDKNQIFHLVNNYYHNDDRRNKELNLINWVNEYLY